MTARPDSELAFARARIVEIASAILDGRLGVVEGARRLMAFRFDADPGQEDKDLLGMCGIESQTDHLPLGPVRQDWDPSELRRMDAEIADHEAFFRESALRRCRALVQRYARSALDHAIAMMQGFHEPWGVAGGWAIELFLNHPLRPHADVDIAILRAHQQKLWIALEPTIIEVVIDGALHTWYEGDMIPAPLHEVHLGWSNGARLEILLNEADDASNEWIYRRDERVRRELGRAFTRIRDVPCLAPEIVLLYKSKAPMAHDELDFSAALPRLDHEQREWLRDALATSVPGHEWIQAITRSSRVT